MDKKSNLTYMLSLRTKMEKKKFKNFRTKITIQQT